MSNLEEANREENLYFKWGMKKGVDHLNKDLQFYKSFMFKGVNYSLYDSVYLHQDGYPETHIGKLVEIYETRTHEKKVKVVWFFRPNEICNFLNDYEPQWNEIFLASGEGQGLSNVNPLEAIIRKCNVLCASNDWRNPRVSEEDLHKADYIFYRTFDVAKRTIEESLPEKIDGVNVEHFVNRKKHRVIVNPRNFEENSRKWTGKSSSSSRVVVEEAVGDAVNNGNSGIRLSPVVKEPRKVALNVDKQGRFPSDGTTLTPKTSVTKCKTGKSSAEKVGVKVEHLFNRKKDQSCASSLNSKANVKEWSGKSSLFRRLGPDKAVGSAIKDGSFGVRVSSVVKEKAAVNVDKQGRIASDNPTLRPQISDENGTRPGRISCSQAENKGKVRQSGDSIPQRASDVPFKKRKLLQDFKASKDLDKSAARLAQNRCTGTESLNVEVGRRPDSDRSGWFKQLPWEQRLRRAQEVGTLLLLENLEPSFTSSEVEDLVWHALHRRAEAKMLQRCTFSSPHSGKALVIFKPKEAADFAISELTKRCLMLADGRPVIASRGSLSESGKPARFVGHLTIEEMRLQMQRQEMKTAVSTAHFSQPNTIEYNMAIQWRGLQKTSDLWWKQLHKRQAEEIQQLRRQLKMDINSQK